MFLQEITDLWLTPQGSIWWWVGFLLIVLIVIVIILYSINKLFEIRKNKRIGSSYRPKARLKTSQSKK